MSAILISLDPTLPMRHPPAALRMLEVLRVPYALFNGERWTYVSRAATALMGTPDAEGPRGSWARIARALRDPGSAKAVCRIGLDRGCRAEISDGTAFGVRDTIVLILPAESGSDSRIDLSAYGLTCREQQVAQLIGAGRTTKEIATALGISFYTARHHTERVYAKLRVHGRVEVALLFSGQRPLALDDSA